MSFSSEADEKDINFFSWSLIFNIASSFVIFNFIILSMYSSMTPTQVSEEMRNAKLVEWSQAFEDLKAINPKLVQDATNLRKVNGDTTNIWTTNADGTKVNNLEKKYSWWLYR